VSKKINIFNFNDYDKTIFHEYLTNHKILFLLKFHPFEEKYYLSKFKNQENSHVILITKKMLQNEFLDLYDILSAVDVLITDYSSVYFDFLLRNKPVIFCPTDLDEYSKSRGFILEPYDFWTPGPKVKDFKNFLKELTKIIENSNYYKEERELINNIVNKYHDDNSCERVYNLVFENNP
jgi:CDP-glycerol glycerophosphotransferase (TagB/SpsB family)